MVRVAIPAVRAEGDNRVRIVLPHDAGDRRAQRGPVLLQGPVRIGQHLHALHAKLGGSRGKLALPDGTERTPGRDPGIPDLPLLSAGGQVIDTVKLAWPATEAMNAPVCALSWTPNWIPISSGASSTDRSRAIRLWAAGVIAAVASSNVLPACSTMAE